MMKNNKKIIGMLNPEMQLTLVISLDTMPYRGSLGRSTAGDLEEGRIDWMRGMKE